MSRRQKTYSALSGYVFQYVYRGHRLLPEPPGRDYVFHVISQRISGLELSIRVEDSVADAVQQVSGRELSPREIYALSKMKLFRVLDELESEGAKGSPSRLVMAISDDEAMEFWETLDL